MVFLVQPERNVLVMKKKISHIVQRAIIMGVASLLCGVVLVVVPHERLAVYAEDHANDGASLPAVDVVPDSAADLFEEDTDIHADGSEVTLPSERGLTITVQADGVTTLVEMYQGTVADALAKAGVTLGDHDESVPAAEVLLVDGLTISVDRIRYRDEITTEPVAFKTIKENDDTLEKGKTSVAQKGVKGVRTIVTRYKEVNGVVTEETVVSNEITTQPIDQIVKIGTKKVYGKYHGMKVEVKPQTSKIDLAAQAAYIGEGARPGSADWRVTVKSDGTIIDQFGNEVKYQNMVSGRATAYYAPKGAGTSTGRLASYGVVAVDPKIIPYGTKMFICSPNGSIVYGYAVAGDTGGTLLKGTVLVDLYVNNKAQCVWIGSKTMNIYILE